MKVTALFLPLVASSSALVFPNDQLDLSAFDKQKADAQQFFHDAVDDLPSFSDVKHSAQDAFKSIWSEVNDASHAFVQTSKNALDEALDSASDLKHSTTEKLEETYFDTKSWLETANENAQMQFNNFGVPKENIESFFEHHPHHPHHPHCPHHGHGKTDKTVYELINESKYTTKLAKLMNKFDDLVETLNGTAANYTVFAPTDAAFAKLPDHDHDHNISKELIEKVLLFHVSPEYFPASRAFATRTIPSLLNSSALGDKPQRLVTNFGLRGLTINFLSRVVALNIFGTNGVIHGLDSILIPPPKAIDIINLLPSAFSTLNLALTKTGLDKTLNSTHHEGGTFFAPSNGDFQRLGLKANAFLFSSHGLKYLKALMEYHIVANETLYSDALYRADDSTVALGRLPRGLYHVDLPTLLKDRSLSIDVARFGRFIDIKINGYSRVSVSDAIARDGVIHIPSNILVPPKKLAGGVIEQWNGKTELSEQELIDRLDPYVIDDDL